MKRWHELFLRWEEGSISEAELTELKQWLSDVEVRRELAEELLLTGVLVEAFRAQQRLSLPVRPAADRAREWSSGAGTVGRSQWARSAAWLTGLAVGVALLTWVAWVLWTNLRLGPSIPEEEQAFALLAELEGEAFVVAQQERRPIRAGQLLLPGQSIATSGAASQAVVNFRADAVHMRLGGDTVLYVASDADTSHGRPLLVLEQGQLEVSVDRLIRRRQISVRTPLGIAVAEQEQTVFHVSEAVGLMVVRGEARFTYTATGQSVRVGAGQYVAVADGEVYTARYLGGEGRVWTHFVREFTDTVSVTFSRDGRWLAAATRQRDGLGVRLGHVEPGEVRALAGDRSVAFSPDGQVLAAGDSGNVRLYDASTGETLRVLEWGERRWTTKYLTFSPDGRWLAVGKGNRDSVGVVEVWDWRTGKLVWARLGHPRGVTALAYSPDGRFLLSASLDQTVTVWDGAQGEPRTQFLLVNGHVVRSMAFAPDGRTVALATGPADTRVRRAGQIVLWDVASERVLAKLHGHGRAVSSVAWAAAGRILISGSADTTIRFWDVERRREYAMLQGHRAEVGFEALAVALSPDETWLASLSFDGTVKLWRLGWLHDEPTMKRPVAHAFPAFLPLKGGIYAFDRESAQSAGSLGALLKGDVRN
ncbi:MAG: WD40 repeat domain-containing protein [Gemmatales bacterium]|nr:WD40 repeat domain-containing protein [Gemmatales bacterium]MDW8222717.1 WD40 repeat domain-containing protein [Gemmatales bacterium]